jgi:hypothetical protein
MVDSVRQAGVFDSDMEEALRASISAAVVEWFSGGGDYAIHCDELTGDAVARDALARLQARMSGPSDSARMPSDRGRCID